MPNEQPSRCGSLATLSLDCNRTETSNRCRVDTDCVLERKKPRPARRIASLCFGTRIAEYRTGMVSIDRTTPAALRHVIYASHHATRIVRAVAAAPWSRSSWGIILNLPSFGVVMPGRVYRAGSPRAAAHFRHVLELGVKTVICVRRGGPSRELREFCAAQRIELRVYDLDQHGDYDLNAAHSATSAALDPRAQPVLVCCEGGRHHAGVVVALLRLATGHGLERAIAEYLSFAAPSPFADNVLFIVHAAHELFGLRPPSSAPIGTKVEPRRSCSSESHVAPVPCALPAE
jgi:hypothetical protein